MNTTIKGGNLDKRENHLLNLLFAFKISPIIIFIFFAAINFSLVLLTYWFSYVYHNVENTIYTQSWFYKYILVQFNLASENNIATWYSSMLLSLSSGLSLSCFSADYLTASSRKERILSFGWVIFIYIFLLLSFDELGSIHEMIGQLFYVDSAKEIKAGWITTLAVPIGLAAFYMIAFGLLKFFQNPKLFFILIAGVTCYVVNPFLEKIEMNILFTNPGATDWHLHDLLIAIEEGFELFGSTLFLLYFLLYALRKRDSVITNSAGIAFKNPSGWIYYLTNVSVFALIISLFLFFLFFGDKLPKGDSGIPLNWFPSLLSFWIFILLALVNISSRNSFLSLRLKIILMLTFLFFSVFWGANLYPFLEWEKLGVFRFLTKGTIALIIFLIGFYINRANEPGFQKYIWVSSLFILALSVFVGKTLTPLVGMIAVSLSFYMMVYSLLKIDFVQNEHSIIMDR
ncbi:MAG: hypothetical protein C4539_05695 [Ignavibacteriales bacterium]|nr:MAG: hypothetical protein C4539_05695 [Ignavibacteriales bacterium]